MSPKIELLMWSRAQRDVSIEERHDRLVSAIQQLRPPLGFEGMDLPATPDYRNCLIASFSAKFPTPGLRFIGHYQNRVENFHFDESARFDDLLRYGFTLSNKALDYRTIVHEDFPSAISASESYRATVSYGYYSLAYCGGFVPSDDGETGFDDMGNQVRNNAVYNQLLADPNVDLNGRNNIYVLSSAAYWDAELCQRALGYGPDEVVSRLQGMVPKVMLLRGGVYIIFSDDPRMTFEKFLQINQVFKPMLGLL